MAAWVPDIFGGFYLMKNHKIANNLTTDKSREKRSTVLESLEFYIKNDVGSEFANGLAKR